MKHLLRDFNAKLGREEEHFYTNNWKWESTWSQ
jgi:hypothetical protein